MNLYDLLVKFYKVKRKEANLLSDFLEKMLQWDPDQRLSASELLNHDWLKSESEDFYQTQEETNEGDINKRPHYQIKKEDFDGDVSFLAEEND